MLQIIRKLQKERPPATCPFSYPSLCFALIFCPCLPVLLVFLLPLLLAYSSSFLPCSYSAPVTSPAGGHIGVCRTLAWIGVLLVSLYQANELT